MRQPGGIVKAAGLGDGPTQGKIAIAKLRLTMPPTILGDFAFALPMSACSLSQSAIIFTRESEGAAPDQAGPDRRWTVECAGVTCTHSGPVASAIGVQA